MFKSPSFSIFQNSARREKELSEVSFVDKNGRSHGTPDSHFDFVTHNKLNRLQQILLKSGLFVEIKQPEVIEVIDPEAGRLKYK